MEDVHKFQQMQDEMSRFEAEISSGDIPSLPPPPPPPLSARPVIAANTFSQVQQRLERVIPPPPMMPPGFMPPGFEAMHQRMMYSGMPPHSMMVPPQVRMRPPMDGMPPMMHGPGMMPGPQAMPGPAAMPPPPKPAVVLSSKPKLYKKERDMEKFQRKEEKFKVLPQPQIVQTKTSEPQSQLKPSPLVNAVTTTITYTPVEQNANPTKPKKEKKGRKVVRTAGGTVWEDVTLLEWPDDDYRLFAGDLGNDVTDELLIRTFSKYSSFQRAKVIRDKRTNKSKGFGFISFKEPADFIKAMKDMNGRYVGSRPIKLTKSTWKNRSLDIVRKKEKEKAALVAQLINGNKS